MYFVTSDSIAAEYLDMTNVIQSLDQHIASCAGNPIRAEVASDFIGEEPSAIDRLLREYVRLGALTVAEEYQCRACQQPLVSIRDDSEYKCDLCERRYLNRELTPVSYFRIAPGAVRNESAFSELNDDWQANDETSLGSIRQRGVRTVSPVTIQFVGGDRGGGPRTQIPIPKEEKAIKEAVALGRYRDCFSFAPTTLAASIDDMIACHRNQPSIVHIVGHGDKRGMVFVRDRDPLVEMKMLEPAEVATLFSNFPSKIRLVLFNTCHSMALAQYLAGNGVVEMAVGVEGLIPDDHAIRFATTFYRQLAEGRPVQNAFDLASLQLSDLDASSRPQLFAAEGVQPATCVFADTEN